MQPDKTLTTSTAHPVSDFSRTTLSGRDSEEYHRELREELKGVKPFKNDAEFFAYARAQWQANQKKNDD